MAVLSEAHLRQLHDEGYAIVADVLTPAEVVTAKAALAAAVEDDLAAFESVHLVASDPNDRNLRIFRLLGRDPIWERLIDHPVAHALASELLGDDAYVLSSLGANIALPGARSMSLHCDDGGVLPAPWLVPHSLNIFIYLDDIDEENGATRILPGSHRFTNQTMAGQEDMPRTIPMEAPAGSMAAVEGRLWHTSGNNVSVDRTRDVVLSFYTADHFRPQYDWPRLLSDGEKAALAPSVRHLLRLDVEYASLDEHVVLWARDPFVSTRLAASTGAR